MPQEGRARSSATPGSRLAVQGDGGQRVVGLSPSHPAGGQGGLCAPRASPLRATPAELQFDISRPARARLESEHVPGCFIAAAAAAGPRGCVCACVCVSVCARPGGREAGAGGGRPGAGGGSRPREKPRR